MPRISEDMAPFYEAGGDALLAEALESVHTVGDPPPNSKSWALPTPDQPRVTYLGALEYYMNARIQAGSDGRERWTTTMIRRRLEMVDQVLRRLGKINYAEVVDGRLPSGRVLLPLTSSTSSTDLRTHNLPSSEPHAVYEDGYAAPSTLEAPYSGPPGPTNPYAFRSLGHDGFSSPSSLDHFARPLRHAVIYGQERRRF
ncbi:hypothetical protein JCM8547_005650 [Rhodosporidiobolus lusitaniae]